MAHRELLNAYPNIPQRGGSGKESLAARIRSSLFRCSGLDGDHGGHIPTQSLIVPIGLNDCCVSHVTQLVFADRLDPYHLTWQLQIRDGIEGDNRPATLVNVDDIDLRQILRLDLPC